VSLGQVFYEYFGFPCQLFHPQLHTHGHLSSGAGRIGPVVADVPKWTQPRINNWTEWNSFRTQTKTKLTSCARTINIVNYENDLRPVLEVQHKFQTFCCAWLYLARNQRGKYANALIQLWILIWRPLFVTRKGRGGGTVKLLRAKSVLSFLKVKTQRYRWNYCASVRVGPFWIHSSIVALYV
jgi:hypothetical protein